MAQQVQVTAGDNGADRYYTAPARERHTAALSTNPTIQESSLEYELRAFEHVIE
jgi:hypothetical protein